MLSGNTIASFDLEIITPRKIVTYLICMIEIEAPSGSFTVAENHAPLISAIKKKGIISFKTNVGNVHTIHVENGGLFWVNQNKARLILHQTQI